MDEHEIGKIVKLEDFTFSPSRFIVYEAGRVISQGLTSMKVCVSMSSGYFREGPPISVILVGNDLSGFIDGSFGFDQCMANYDRLLMMGDPFEMADRNYSATEPFAGSIFTENGEPVKISFSMNERLIELF